MAYPIYDKLRCRQRAIAFRVSSSASSPWRRTSASMCASSGPRASQLPSTTPPVPVTMPAGVDIDDTVLGKLKVQSTV